MSSLERIAEIRDRFEGARKESTQATQSASER